MHVWGANIGVENGVRGAEGAEDERSRAFMSEAPQARHQKRQGVRNGKRVSDFLTTRGFGSSGVGAAPSPKTMLVLSKGHREMLKCLS